MSWIKLTRSDAGEIWVNPDLIVAVSGPDAHDPTGTQCRLLTAGGNWLCVQEHVDTVRTATERLHRQT
jgi:hypothetical protein